MKMRTPHVIPLSTQAIEILELLKTLTSDGPLLFPGDRNPRKSMSNGTILVALRRMGYQGIMTGHGFRGLASTVLHEQGFEHAHIKLQLAHAARNAVSAAYNHALSRAAAKCNGRQRIISLVTAEELWSAECLLERARRCGASSPLHYVFPMRHRGGLSAAWDPTTPMTNSGFKKQWEEVREATGLKRFRIYDTRHTGGTRLAEAGVNISVIRARMGHLSREMHEYYCRIAEPIQRQQIQDAYAWQKRRVGRIDDTPYPPFPGRDLEMQHR